MLEESKTLKKRKNQITITSQQLCIVQMNCLEVRSYFDMALGQSLEVHYLCTYQILVG